MKLIEGMLYAIVFSLVWTIMECIAIKNGYKGNMPSTDFQYLVDGIIVAGTLSGGDK